MKVAKHQLIVHQQQLKHGDLGQGKCTLLYACVHMCVYIDMHMCSCTRAVCTFSVLVCTSVWVGCKWMCVHVCVCMCVVCVQVCVCEGVRVTLVHL